MQPLSLIRQRDSPVQALEQPDAKLILEHADLPAHSALCEAQLISCQREALQPGDSVKRLKQRKIWILYLAHNFSRLANLSDGHDNIGHFSGGLQWPPCSQIYAG